MDQIEKLELCKEDGLHYVRFIAYQQNKLIKVNDTMSENFNIGFFNYFGRNDKYNVASTRNTEKLVKAFNHLRKLCNAPEPISFD